MIQGDITHQLQALKNIMKSFVINKVFLPLILSLNGTLSNGDGIARQMTQVQTS